MVNKSLKNNEQSLLIRDEEEDWVGVSLSKLKSRLNKFPTNTQYIEYVRPL